MNQVEQAVQKYTGAVEKGVPIRKEIKELRKDINSSVNKCIKHGFDRPTAEFNYVKDIIYNNETAENTPRLESLLRRLKAVIEYCSVMGMESEYKQFADELGLDISLKNSVSTLESPELNNETKFRNEWSALFGKEPSDDKSEILKDLLQVSIEAKRKEDDLRGAINVDLAEELEGTGISKGTLNKGINLKIRSENKDDVEDKVNSIVEGNLMNNEALQTII
jgi:hypothetical protein